MENLYVSLVTQKSLKWRIYNGNADTGLTLQVPACLGADLATENCR